MRQKLFNSILKHAENEYPNEACGLIVDTGKTQKFIPCKNMSDNPKEHFLISPDEQLEAEKQGEIIMIIHSHPDSPMLVPSEFDRIQCDYSGVEWGIISYPEGDFCTISPRVNRDYTGRQWLLGCAHRLIFKIYNCLPDKSRPFVHGVCVVGIELVQVVIMQVITISLKTGYQLTTQQRMNAVVY